MKLSVSATTPHGSDCIKSALADVEIRPGFVSPTGRLETLAETILGRVAPALLRTWSGRRRRTEQEEVEDATRVADVDRVARVEVSTIELRLAIARNDFDTHFDDHRTDGDEIGRGDAPGRSLRDPA